MEQHLRAMITAEDYSGKLSSLFPKLIQLFRDRKKRVGGQGTNQKSYEWNELVTGLKKNQAEGFLPHHMLIDA
jgi:hypothetical protein